MPVPKPVIPLLPPQNSTVAAPTKTAELSSASPQPKAPSIPDAMPKLASAKLPRTKVPSNHIQLLIDLETSGSKKQVNRMIQLAGEVYDTVGTKVGSSFSEAINVDVPIQQFLTANVHGIAKEYLLGKDYAKAVLSRFIEWLKPLVIGATKPETVLLVAHNGNACDFRMLGTELARAGLTLPATKKLVTFDT